MVLIRQITVSVALLATIFAAPHCNAQQRAAARQGYPGRPMPPDMVAPPDTPPANAPKPERNAMPQSDQPAKAAAQQSPASAPLPVQPAAAGTHQLTARKRRAKPSPVPAPQPPPQVATAPPPPATLQQMPPSPPEVQYRDGLLTVSAKNSTLLDVLNAIRAQSGANMTLPPAGLNDRLFVQAGPAPAREVLSKLLSGTNFDYVLVGSPQDPGALTQVIVTARQASGSPAAQTPGANPGAYPQQTRLPGMGTPATEEEEEQQPAPQPQQQAMPGGFGGPGPFQPNPAMAPPGVANPTPMQPTPGPTGIAPVQPPQQPPQGMQTGQPQQMKTPEQLLQELKQMQQQQQQQQQKPPQ